MTKLNANIHPLFYHPVGEKFSKNSLLVLAKLRICGNKHIHEEII